MPMFEPEHEHDEHEERPHLHRAPSVGSITKKIMAINPNLNVKEIMEIVRQSIDPMGGVAGDFHSAEVIVESRALQLARESLQGNA